MMRVMRFALLTILCFASAHAAEAPADLGKRLAACAACHGEQGEGRAGSEYYPHLAGKPAGYLLDQLQAFRDGRRVYPQMHWLMRNLGDDYLGHIARFYATMPARSSATVRAVDAATAARALHLVREGDASRGVPACAACHGENLAGLEPGIPALLGLPADYVIAQLGAWRTGVRTAREPDCMAQIAKALAPDDMRILGTWLAAQGHDTPLAPAPAGSFTPPVACGSLPAGAPRNGSDPASAASPVGAALKPAPGAPGSAPEPARGRAVAPARSRAFEPASGDDVAPAIANAVEAGPADRVKPAHGGPLEPAQ